MDQATPIFSRETFDFFRQLGRNNRKTWMDANRERYQQHVVAPFRLLLERLAPEMLRLDPNFDTRGRTGVNFSRINRDIRFAKDKRPYRSQMYLMFRDAEAGDAGGQLYLNLGAEAVTAGFRIYRETGSARNSRFLRLTAPRAMAHPAWLGRQKRRLDRRYQSYWYTTDKGEWTKHDGWPLRLEEWKRLRGWVVRRALRPAAATRAGFDRELLRIFRELYPLHRFTTAPRL
jgi:uncharacterized protein (DUF2461 family)